MRELPVYLPAQYTLQTLSNSIQNLARRTQNAAAAALL
jgi:hypothetical protein